MATPLVLDACLLHPPRRRIPSSIWSNWTTANEVLGGRGTASQSPRRKSALRARIREPIRALMGEEKIPTPSVRIVAVVGEGSVSPLKNAPWEQVMLHTAPPAAKPIMDFHIMTCEPSAGRRSLAFFFQRNSLPSCARSDNNINSLFGCKLKSSTCPADRKRESRCTILLSKAAGHLLLQPESVWCKVNYSEH